MASSSPPPNRGWRDGAPGNKPTSGGPTRAWRKGDEAPGRGRRRWSKGSRRLVAGGAILAGAALLAWLATLLIPPKPACLVLLGAKNDATLALPHNAYGWKALRDLAAATGNADSGSALSRWWSGTLKLQAGPQELTSDEWGPKWFDFKEKTVVVFLPLHGGADAAGPYFFLEDPNGEKVLRVEKVLDQLDSEALRGKNKVLILDPTQESANWPRGMLHNDFVRRLKDLKGRIEEIPNLVVLCASDDDQRSWASEEWQQTAFAHHVVEGLKGAADLDGNQRVSAWELHQYAAAKVKEWAQANRNAVQTPILLGGEDRAKGIDLLVVEKPYEAPPAPEAAPLPLADLKAAWEQCEALRREVPSPAVYAPQVWRRYQDTLLRYEQLVRAGDPTEAAGGLKGQLDGLRRDLARARQVGADAALLTALPMPAALGQAPPWSGQEEKEADFRRLAQALWDAPAAERPAARAALHKWADGQGEPADLNRKLLQARFGDWLLQKLAAGPVDRAALEKAAEVLKLQEGDSPARPAEAHFLVMLARDVDKAAPPGDTLRLALDVRRLAERVALAALPGDDGRPFYPYSESVSPWITGCVEEADGERFQGENLLFASDADSWKEAQAHLSKAKAVYAQAGSAAVVLRQALATRDEVLAALPYYSQWLARQRISPDRALRDAQMKRLEELVGTAEGLWKDTHDLAARLDEAPDPKAGCKELAARAATLKALTAKVRESFQAIKDAFDARCKGLRDEKIQDRWHQIDAALAVPLIEDVDLRLALLRNSRGISGKLAPSGDDAGGAATEPSGEARETARRQGRLALAALGDHFADAKARDRAARLVEQPEAGRWWASLTEAGDAVGAAWRRLPKEAAERFSEGLRADDMAKAGAPWVQAAGLCRLLDGASAARVPADPFGPAEAERRWRLHNLLLEQARRTLRDHWFSEGETPYYVSAGRACVEDARRLALAGADAADADLARTRPAEADALAKRLALARLTPVGPAHLALTSEKDITLTWGLKAGAGVPEGVAVVWPEVADPLRLLRPERDAGRRPLTEWTRDPIHYQLESRDAAEDDGSAPKPKEQAVVLHGLYRGERLLARTAVTIQRVADAIVYRYPEGPSAGVAVRATPDVTEGALAIVLDASGSMGVEGAYKRSTPCKYHDATAALKQVLRAVPKGTKVSLRLFGRDYDRDGKTIREQVLAPTEWGPDGTTQLEDLMDKVEPIRPKASSPIAEAMVDAKKDLKGARGFKTLLVLTDGQDTEFEGGEKNVGAYLTKEFAETDTFVNVVLFRVDAKEKETAEAQFGVVKKFLRPGLLLEADDNAKLLPYLTRATLPRLRLLDGKGDPARGTPPEGLPISFTRRGGDADNLSWSGALKPDVYDAVVYNAFRRGARLERGDRLIVALNRDRDKDGDRITFERAFYADERENRDKPRRKNGDWLATVLKNGLSRNSGLEMLVGLEGKSKGEVLRQPRPGFCWLEVHKDGKPRSGLRWGNEPDYPAPVWRLDAADWLQGGKGPTPPELHAWWTAAPELDVDRPVADVPANPPQNPDKGFPLEVPVKGDVVVIEGVVAEDREVRTAAGAGTTEKRPCLVVRLRHAPGKPVWVQLDGHKGGQEHRFYSQSDKCTAIFWDVPDAAGRKFTLNLSSLQAFKDSALSVEFKDLAPPDFRARAPDKVRLKAPE